MDEENKIYNHAQSENEARLLWDQEKIYSFTPSQAPTFSIDTPPPTVSGSLHIGHIFSYTHPDLIARYKRMQGFNVFYPMGFDDNGLATERFVEKKNSTKAHLMKRSDFIALCLKETDLAEKQFEQLWRRIGLSIDWSKLYSTISPRARRIAQHSFLELYNKNLVYRKLEPSLYCTTCRTSVAQAELDNAEVTTTFNNIVFTTEDGERLTIATTRPELLPACVSVFFHPEDDRYKHLNNRFAITPVFEKPVRIMADDKVDPAKGTGLVMCCTFGDQTDIAWYKAYKLPFIQVVGLDGKWTQASGPLAGLTVHEARKKVLELLQQNEALVDQKSIVHNVNTHERCKQEIEYLALPQWFIKILDNKEAFLQRAEEIDWHPAFMKTRYIDWVKNLHWDWGISRQRFYGVPFPVWHCQDCSHTILAQPKDLPVDPQEQTCPGGACPKCSSKNIEPETDIMDTWNTSSLTPQVNLSWPEQSPDKLTLPMSMRPQAHDIIRTWAFYTIVKAHYHHNTIPWKSIMISGHVLAGKEKISKSKENSKMAPEELLKQYPADVIRYWAANGKLGTDTAFSDNQLKIGQRLVTKIWNAFRFISEHVANSSGRLQSFDGAQDERGKPAPDFDPGACTDPLNQWILHALSTTYQNYQKSFDNFEYDAALEAVEKFFWTAFCDNYLELVKDRLFNPANYTEELIAQTQYTLSEIGFALLQMFAPFVPYITETLYQKMYRQIPRGGAGGNGLQNSIVSLHITRFDNKRFAYSFEQSTKLINHVLTIVATVRKLKSEGKMSLKTDLVRLDLHCTDTQTGSLLQTQTTLLAGITKAKSINVITTPLDQAALQETPEGLIAAVKVE